ncbi:hypothetical protein [Pseudanabaena mucicola]|uniref:hypothetical protein n=1 Tax=Pseudanabaena mucicola TaxID=71190 RepID=UPI0016813610|nr:hypothetical protein [Pseudanabaena mucicola]
MNKRVEKMRPSKDKTQIKYIYIVRLIKQVIILSLETVKILKGLPDMGLSEN